MRGADHDLAQLVQDTGRGAVQAPYPTPSKELMSMNVVLGDLPTWNLADLYSSPAGADLETDLQRATREAEAFAKDYEGKIAGLDGKTLGAAVARFEALSDLMGRIGSYAQLYHAQDLADPQRGQFSQNVSEKLTDIGSKLLFFGLELKKIEDADLALKLKILRWRGTSPGCATCACSDRTSCRTNSRSTSMSSQWSAPARGPACSTRPSRGCAIRSGTRC